MYNVIDSKSKHISVRVIQSADAIESHINRIMPPHSDHALQQHICTPVNRLNRDVLAVALAVKVKGKA